MVGNYKPYRRFLKHQTAPCVPFIGVFVSDLTFLDDGNPNEISVKFLIKKGEDKKEKCEANLINILKRRMLAKAIKENLKFGRVKYPFESVPYIQRNLLHPPEAKEAEVYEESLLSEPRGGPSDDVVPVSVLRSLWCGDEDKVFFFYYFFFIIFLFIIFLFIFFYLFFFIFFLFLFLFFFFFLNCN